MTKVLLTGGSGFIAAHILEILLQHGHEVITTVRSEDKAARIRNAHPNAPLTVAIVPDIVKPNAFDSVVSTPGLEAVIHTASPFHFNYTDAKTELLDPALIGTTSILKAIKDYAPGVKRVVITSSFASMLSEQALADPTTIFTEANWNPYTYEVGLQGDKVKTYRTSKTIAEKAAWKFLEDNKPGFDLATICPPLVFGPVVHHLESLSSINTSNQRFVDMIQGGWKQHIPETGTYLWVDVRDVARAHVLVMEKQAAGGQRFFLTAGRFTNRDLADVVRKNFPDLGGKLPASDVPGGGYPEEGIYGYDNSKASKELGIDWISLEQSAVETVKSLIGDRHVARI
ncbi:putative NAD dependent epimerase/dehydratase [Pestalotiopsis sp. NC0098]|nr:putative NAD dependent epimerase/dehydratase [Pestalotiopsis sp. NC0098]